MIYTSLMLCGDIEVNLDPKHLCPHYEMIVLAKHFALLYSCNTFQFHHDQLQTGSVAQCVTNSNTHQSITKRNANTAITCSQFTHI